MWLANRLFARSDHMVQSCTVGLPKNETTRTSSPWPACHARTRKLAFVTAHACFHILILMWNNSKFLVLFWYAITGSIENLDDSVVPSTSQDPVGNTKRQLNLSLPEAASTPSRKVTTPRRRCGAQTKTGSACKRLIANGSFRCNSHSRIEASYIPDEC